VARVYQAHTYNHGVPIRFYAPAAEHPGDVVDLPRDEAQHLFRVLRLKIGSAVRIFNGRGAEFDAVVATASKDGARIRVGSGCTAVPEARVALTLAQAVLKGDKMDDVVRDAVMMGVAAIQPLVTDRTEIALVALERGHRRERWQRIAVSSSKQCGRAVVPAVLEPRTFKDATAALLDVGPQATLQTTSDTAADPAPGIAFGKTPPGLMCVEPTASADALSLRDLGATPPSEVTILIGPEGGWAAEEIVAGSAAGRLVTFGPRTLRADAMALVALTALFARWREI
jgi:16S rRNA (uracil1498-N3)-methyltransferase